MFFCFSSRSLWGLGHRHFLDFSGLSLSNQFIQRWKVLVRTWLYFFVSPGSVLSLVVVMFSNISLTIWFQPWSNAQGSMGGTSSTRPSFAVSLNSGHSSSSSSWWDVPLGEDHFQRAKFNCPLPPLPQLGLQKQLYHPTTGIICEKNKTLSRILMEENDQHKPAALASHMLLLVNTVKVNKEVNSP